MLVANNLLIELLGHNRVVFCGGLVLGDCGKLLTCSAQSSRPAAGTNDLAVIRGSAAAVSLASLSLSHQLSL